MSKKDFLKLEQNKSIRTGIITSAILCYVSAGITTLVGLLGSSIGGVNFNAFVLVDAAAILALGLFIHLKQSFPASIILLVYSIANTIYMSIQAGTFFSLSSTSICRVLSSSSSSQLPCPTHIIIRR